MIGTNSINDNNSLLNNNLHEIQTSKNITPYRGGFYDPLLQRQFNNNSSSNNNNIKDDCKTTVNSINNLSGCINKSENVKAQRSL